MKIAVTLDLADAFTDNELGESIEQYITTNLREEVMKAVREVVREQIRAQTREIMFLILTARPGRQAHAPG